MSLGKPLVVKGRLEDATIFEALHIIGWLKKTGSLRVEARPVRGVILIRRGLVVCAYTQSTIGRMLELDQGLVTGDKEEWLRHQILLALHELADLAEGEFYFFKEELSRAPELGSINVSNIVLEHGLSADQLALTLAHQRDEKRHVPSASEPLRPERRTAGTTRHPVFGRARATGPTGRPRQPTTILLADDEARVREILGSTLRLAGYQVRTAAAPAEAVAIAMELVRSKHHLIVVADLEMLTTSQRSFEGGLELVRNLVESGIDIPVLLMTEKLRASSREAGRQLGVRKMAFKPSLSKLDPEQYQTDLRAFASLLLDWLKEMEPAAAEPGKTVAGSDALTRRLLASMGEQLSDPERSLGIARHVLPVAASIAAKNRKNLERGEQPPPHLAKRINARKYERIGSLMMETTFRHGEDIGRGYLTDLSETGAFLSTDKLLPIGEIIRLRIALPYKLGVVSTEARIMWINYRSEDHTALPHGMGLAFVGPFS